MSKTRLHTTIGLKKATKDRLNESKAPGQCYDGFLCQLMDLWEETYNGHGLNSIRKPKSKKYTLVSV